MLSKQDRINIVVQAGERWRARTEQRKQAGIIKEREKKAIEIAEKRVDNYTKREKTRRLIRLKRKEPISFPERIIKENDIDDFPPNESAKKAGIPVARIYKIPNNNYEEESLATGFLIFSNLLITNYHVFPNAADAANCGANFLYEKTLNGVNIGYSFEIKPDKFFLANEKLDYAIVYVEDISLKGNYSLRSFGFLNLIETPGKILVGQPINIIQHPLGDYKKYAAKDNKVVDILEDDGYIHYTTDTNRGSSGSPAFNKFWEVAALHHSGVPFIVNNQIMSIYGAPWDDNMDDNEIQWIANEGISISRIIESLKKETLIDPKKKSY